MTPTSEPPDVSRVVHDPPRLAALHRSGLLDTPPEEDFDRLTRQVTASLGVPVALVTLVDEGRQFLKSCVGLPEPWASRRQTPLSYSFCKHNLLSAEPLVIGDARRHPLVRDNRAVTEIGVIAYAGIPLVTEDGHALGSLCAIDTRPRAWTPADIATLRIVAAAVMAEIERRAASRTDNEQGAPSGKPA